MMRQRTPTSYDVARLAGVSRATVSAVISGSRSNTRVSDETRQRVLTAAAELGYSPHWAAQGLSRQQSRTIGFIPYSSSTSPYEEPISALFSLHLARAAMRRRLLLVEVSTETSQDSEKLAQLLLNQRVQCAIFDRPKKLSEVQRLVDHGLQVILLMQHEPLAKCSTITIDAAPGIHAAIDHLVAQGHRRIAFLGHHAEHPHRFKAFADALLRHEIVLPEAYVQLQSEYSLAEGRAATQALLTLTKRPTAIFSASDNLASGALHALYEARLHVPDEISLISYNDAFAAYLLPPLTSVAQPFEEMADHAISLAAERFNQPDDVTPESAHIILPSHLIVRQSTQPPQESRDGVDRGGDRAPT